MSNDESTDDEVFTTKTDVRVRYLGSVLAFLLIFGWMVLIGAVAFGYASFATISGSAFVITALLVLAAGTWTFGIDLIDAYTGGK